MPVVQQIIADGRTRLHLVKNDVGRGVVGAIRTGFNHVQQGPVLVVMADLSDDLSQVDAMVDLYRQGYQVVAGSRYMRGGQSEGCAAAQGRYVARGRTHAALVSRHSHPRRDQRLQALRQRHAARMTIESRAGFELSLELTVKAFLAGRAHRRDSHHLAEPHRRRIPLPRMEVAAALSEVVFLRLPTQARTCRRLKPAPE